jgi:outer membrane protein
MAGIVCVLASLSAMSPPGYAEGKPRFGYVDLNKVLLESKTGKRNKAEIEKLVKQKQEQITKEVQKTKNLHQTLEKDQLVLTDAQRRTKQREIQQKREDLQQMERDAQREVNKKNNEFLNKAMGEVRQITAEIAREEKLTLVFDKYQMPVLYAEDGPDLTDKVMKKYDAKAGK